MKRRSVVEREMKSETLIVRLRPSTKQKLMALSDVTGYTMSALVEHAVENLEVDGDGKVDA